MGETRNAPVPPERRRFGPFEFVEETLELTKSGRTIAVRPQPLKLLALLLAEPGKLVSRDDLRRALWNDDTFVDFEQGVNHAIRELRAALGDDAESSRFIQTLPRRGYRFVAPVELLVPVRSSPSLDEPRGSPKTIRNLFAPALGVAAIGVAVLIASLSLRVGTAGNAPPGALAVRPFVSDSDPALGIGLANAIALRLGAQQAFAVRSSGPGDRGGSNTPDLAISLRGASHALDGDIVIAGPMVDVVARLRDTRGATVWSERFHVRRDDLFSIEDFIAEGVVTALHVRLAAAEQERFRRRYTSNSAAYNQYLRGRAALVKYTPEGTRSAIDAFENALRSDPSYALARAGLAMASSDMYLRFSGSADVEQWGERAEAEARAALDLDTDLAEAHLARSAVARKREFDWNATLAAGRRALALNPNLDQARFFIAGAYYHNGYMREALVETEKGRQLRGMDIIEPIRIEALVALFSGEFAPAQARLEDVSRLSSQPIGDTYLALAYYYTGNIDRARTLLESLANSRSASTSARAGAALAAILAAQHETTAARAFVDRVIRNEYRDHHVAYSLGVAYGQLGEADQANRWLRTAADTGFPCLPFFERDPLLEPLRHRPDFPELLRYVRTRRDASLTPGAS